MRQSQKRVLIDLLESRRLMSVAPAAIVIDPPVTPVTPTTLEIGTRDLHDATFTAANGRSYLVTTTGATATLNFASSDVPLISHHHAIFTPGEIETLDSILIANATPGKATLNIIRASAGRGSFSIGSITGGDIGTINAMDAVMTGSVTLSSVHKITLAGNAGAVMSLGSYPSSLKFSGNFTGSLTESGLTSFSAYSLTQSTIITNGAFIAGKFDIGSFIVTKQIAQSTIASTGNINSITAGYIENSTITAGSHAAGVLPESVSTFYLQATIKKLAVSTKRIDGFDEGFVGDSVIAAYYLGALQLGSLNNDGGGLAGHNIASITAISPAGGLNQVKIHLVQSQMPNVTKLQSSLSHLGIPYQAGVSGYENTVFYNFSVNVLR